MAISQEKVANVNKVRNEFISLDVRDKPFSDIIEGIIEQTGKNIIYDEEIKNILVTIKLIQVPWRKVLDVIAKEYNCLVEDLEQVIKVSKPPTVTMEFDGADIRDVINQIATIANKNIVISEEIKGNVTLRLQNVPWKEALDAIIKNGGYVLVQEADGRILRVVPPEEIQAQLETEIFTLRFVRPKSPYVAKMTSIYFKEQQTKLDAGSKDAIEFSKFSLLTALNTVATPNKGKVTYDEITNTLVIVDTKPKIDKMREIIRQLDIEPKQIFYRCQIYTYGQYRPF
jgi:type II secretory pathway component HofQ